MNATTNPIANLTAAESAIVQALNAAANRLDQIGTSNLDEALQRVQASADAAKARLELAVGCLTGTCAGVVDCFAAAAADIFTALALNDLQPVAPAALPASAIVPIVDPTSVQTDGVPARIAETTPAEPAALNIDHVGELPGPAVSAPTVETIPPATDAERLAHFPVAVRDLAGIVAEAQQAASDGEPTAEPSTVAIAPQQQPRAAESAGQGVVAVAACSPAEASTGSQRDDRKLPAPSTRRKPRGKPA